MEISHVTPVLIVKNGEATIAATLDSLAPFKNVVVYDNGSEDNSLLIAQRYRNVLLIQGEFFGFGITKNMAASHAETDWIFSLDCDEVPDQVLINSIAAWQPEDKNCVADIHRENFFCGKAIKTNGWGNDVLTRLYNKEKHNFTKSQVHEKIELHSTSYKTKLSGKLQHTAITDLKQILDKAQLYSEIYANSEKAKLYPFSIIILKTWFAFLRSYLLKLGLLSGWRGLVISMGDSIGVFFKYAKVYQKKNSGNI
ncbi:MAG: glycosyltransferase family 2 protein [Halomonas sp.]|nr:glycosyltransferase family 2 protein [Halomonas sp.]TVP50154.1 MAG: glycosyltransferase family 2 protein [Halomonas sp.]